MGFIHGIVAISTLYTRISEGWEFRLGIFLSGFNDINLGWDRAVMEKREIYIYSICSHVGMLHTR